jgi:hypothetical protein
VGLHNYPVTISLGSTLPAIGTSIKWVFTQRNTLQPSVIEFLYVAVKDLLGMLRHSHYVFMVTYSFY